ncbi:MAG: NAD(P)H-hydrate epimerase, partial [Candidatus Bathyarchaeia archaeon]
MVAEELNARYLGVSELQLMENAGAHVAWQVASRFPRDKKVLVFSGPGGNGGDGFVAARHLAQTGFRVDVILVGHPEDMKKEAVKANWRSARLMRRSIRTFVAQDSKALPEIEGDILIDALLGIGVTKPLR